MDQFVRFAASGGALWCASGCLFTHPLADEQSATTDVSSLQANAAGSGGTLGSEPTAVGTSEHPATASSTGGTKNVAGPFGGAAGTDCMDVCATSETRCSDGSSSACEADGDGCFGWSSITPCLSGRCLNPEVCEPLCDDDFDCDDGITCTVDVCIEERCTNTADASLCADSADGNCDLKDDCQYPECTAENCIAGPCQTAECVADTCIRTDLCEGSQACCADSCVSVGCDDGVSCTVDSCDDMAGCVHTPEDSACGSAVVCTTKRCDVAAGCATDFTSGACDDGNFCNGSDTCQAGSCSAHAGDPCSGGDMTCDEGAGECKLTGPYAPRTGAFNMLVYSRTEGFRHSAGIAAGQTLLKEIAGEHDITLTLAETNELITAAGLSQFEVVFFLNPSGDVFDSAEETPFEAWAKDGGGFVGVHSAADLEKDWDFYKEFLGQYYDGHSRSNTTGTIEFDSAGLEHPAIKGLPNPWVRTEEWWKFGQHALWSILPGFQVLGRVSDDISPGPLAGQPIIWSREHNGYRAFYSGLGHDPDDFEDPEIKTHLTGAILWAARREHTLP